MWDFFPFKYLKKQATRTDTDVLNEIVTAIKYVNARTETALKYILVVPNEEIRVRCADTGKSALECHTDLCYQYADMQLLQDIGEPYRNWLNRYYVNTGDRFWEPKITC